MTHGEPTILIVPPQQLSEENRTALSAIGVVVIEMDDPSKARLLKQSAELSSSDMLHAAVKSIITTTKRSSTAAAMNFGEEMALALIEARSKAQP